MDKQILENALKVAGGVQLRSHEVDMIVMEFDKGNGRFDFDLFEKEFNEFTTGKSELSTFANRPNEYYNQFTNYIKQNIP